MSPDLAAWLLARGKIVRRGCASGRCSNNKGHAEVASCSSARLDPSWRGPRATILHPDAVAPSPPRRRVTCEFWGLSLVLHRSHAGPPVGMVPLINVERGLAARIRERRDGFLLQVLGDDAATILEGMAEARRRLLTRAAGAGPSAGEAGAPKYVSDVMPSRDGAILYIDASHSPAKLLAEIPALIVECLEQAEVSDARLVIPALDQRLITRECPTVTLYLFAEPRGRGLAPPLGGWLERAVEWADARSTEEAWIRAAIPFPVNPESADQLFLGLARSRPAAELIVGQLWAAAKGVGFHALEHMVSIAGGGTALANAEWASLGLDLKTFALSCIPDLAYACLDVRPCFWLQLPLNERQYGDGDNGAGLDVLADCLSDFVPDVFPWQLLGPKHREALDLEAHRGLKDVGHGYAELEFAPIGLDLTAPDRLGRLRAFGKPLLAPLLIDRDRAISERSRRRREVKAARERPNSAE